MFRLSRFEPSELTCGSLSKLEGLATAAQDRPLRIALLAPPWSPLETGSPLALLADALVDRGHQVELIAPPGSTSKAMVVSLLDRPHPREIGSSLVEADYVGRAFAYIERRGLHGRPFDLVHDHSGWVALAMADRLPVPLLHTIHGAFDERASSFYAAHGHKAALTCLSRAQAATRPNDLRIDGIVPHPVDVDAAPHVPKEDHLLWIGRFTAEDGAHRAIEVAQRSGTRLVLAGTLRPENERFFATRIEPHLRGDRVEHVEIADRHDLLARARALLVPTQRREPFATVMVEAMAAGTPVIAFAHGSAPEIVESGRSGLLVSDEEAMAQAIQDLPTPEQCRASARERFGPDVVAARYDDIYRAIAAPASPDSVPSIELLTR